MVRPRSSLGEGTKLSIHVNYIGGVVVTFSSSNRRANANSDSSDASEKELLVNDGVADL